MAFEPETRFETVVFIETSGGARRSRVKYRCARFVFVEYDGVPDRYLEPVSASELFDITGVAGAFDPNRGSVVGFEYYDQNPIAELHDFSDSGL